MSWLAAAVVCVPFPFMRFLGILGMRHGEQITSELELMMGLTEWLESPGVCVCGSPTLSFAFLWFASAAALPRSKGTTKDGKDELSASGWKTGAAERAEG